MILGQGLAHYFSDVPDMKNHFPYKVCKITIYHNNDKVLGVKANYYSFKSMTTIKCKAHKTVKQLFGVKKSKLKLEHNEYINYVSGNYNEHGIIVIAFRTNTDKELLVGAQLGAKFEFQLPEQQQLGALSGGLNSKQLQYLEINATTQSTQNQRNNIQYSWDIDQWYLLYSQKHQTRNQSQPLPQLRSEESKDQISLDEGQEIQFSDIFETNWDQRFVIQVCNPSTLAQEIENLLKLSKQMEYQVIVWKMHDCIVQDNTLLLPDQKKPFLQVTRKFKEFILLREVLVAKWPGIYVPYLPVESIISDFSSKNIEKIKHQLESFITRISNIPFLYQSIEFQIFLKGVYKQDCVTKQLELLTSPATLDQIKLRYEQTFSVFRSSPPLNDAQKTKLRTFQEFLIQHRFTLDVQIKILQQLNNKHHKMVQLQYNLSKHYIPQHYQTIHCEQVPSQTPIIMNNNIFDELIQQILFEQREIQALRIASNYLNELELQRVELQHKISGKSFNLRPPSQEELLQYRRDWDAIGVVQQLISSIYCEYYINAFYQEKAQFYYFVTNRIAKIQQENLKIRKVYWEDIQVNLL